MSGQSSRPSQELGDIGRFAGLGLQFALTMAVLGGLGYWLDTKLGTLPWLLVVGVVLGAIGGFVRIVKAVPGKPSFTPKSPPLEDDPPEPDPWADPDPDGAPRGAPKGVPPKERAE